MKQRIGQKSVIVCSVILGVFISLQLKTIYIENNGLTTSKKGEQLIVKLKGLKTEENNLEKEIDDIKNKIESYKTDVAGKAIGEEISKYRKIAGYTDVEGKGIEIKLNPLEGSESLTYNYDLILSMINKLNSASAFAIEINGNRMISQSYLNISKDSLYMNDAKLTEPIVIKAIGDPDTLASALQIKYGIIWEIEKYYNYKVDVIKSDNILVKGYDKEVNSANIENSGAN